MKKKLDLKLAWQPVTISYVSLETHIILLIAFSIWVAMIPKVWLMGSHSPLRRRDHPKIVCHYSNRTHDHHITNSEAMSPPKMSRKCALFNPQNSTGRGAIALPLKSCFNGGNRILWCDDEVQIHTHLFGVRVVGKYGIFALISHVIPLIRFGQLVFFVLRWKELYTCCNRFNTYFVTLNYFKLMVTDNLM